MKTLAFVTLIASLTMPACDSRKHSDTIVRREGQPDYVKVPDNDPEMDKAVQTARDSVDTFIAALKAPTPGQSGFSVKKPFEEGGKFEHIWLSNASFDGTQFSGHVDNVPVDMKNVKLGEPATAAKSEISDWFYIENGKLVGGYTIRVLYHRMSPDERKVFDTNGVFKIE
jgi:uncharacterized protein YegJ (DUF2314 family)